MERRTALRALAALTLPMPYASISCRDAERRASGRSHDGKIRLVLKYQPLGEPELFCLTHTVETGQRVAQLGETTPFRVKNLEPTHQARGDVVGESVTVTRLGPLRVAEADAFVQANVHPTRERRVERLFAQHEQHVLVDLGLKLELEMCRWELASGAIGYVQEVADAFDELAKSIQVGCVGKVRRADLDFERPVFRIADSHGLAFAVVAGSQKRRHRRSALEAIELLEPALHSGSYRHGVVVHGLVPQCKPPEPRTGTNPRAPSSLARVADPERSQRS